MTRISSPVYNGRLDYPATQCAGTSVEGERVRATARPHPTHTVPLGDTTCRIVADPGWVNLLMTWSTATRSHTVAMPPWRARELGMALIEQADLAELPEEL